MAPPICFIFLDVHRPGRKVKVADSHIAIDFAACMQELADIHFPKTERIHIVLGICPPTRPAHFIKPSRLLNRLEIPYVPKRASWLNMVEIEIGVLRGQWWNRRVYSKEGASCIRSCCLGAEAQ